MALGLRIPLLEVRENLLHSGILAALYCCTSQEVCRVGVLPRHFGVGHPSSAKHIPASVSVGVMVKNFGSQPLRRSLTPSVLVPGFHPKASARGLSIYKVWPSRTTLNCRT